MHARAQETIRDSPLECDRQHPPPPPPPAVGFLLGPMPCAGQSTHVYASIFLEGILYVLQKIKCLVFPGRKQPGHSSRKGRSEGVVVPLERRWTIYGQTTTTHLLYHVQILKMGSTLSPIRSCWWGNMRLRRGADQSKCGDHRVLV